jgi:pimeloyl-ACP methyl ester carboxylesterase
VTEVRELTVDAGGTTVSGMLAEPEGAPRGTLLALHGGAARARYWHSPVDPGSGLLLLGALLGWRVLALDRPGYGASTGMPGLRAAEQVDPVERALHAVVGDPGPVVLVGHSLGGIVAAHAAAAGRPAGLVGLALGGAPIAYTAEQTARMADADVTGPVMRRSRRHPRPDPATWSGPPDTWDPRLTDHHRSLTAATPRAEFLDARDAPSGLPPLLAQVTVPVQFAVAEYEETTAASEVLLAAAAAALTGTAEADLLLVRGSGHNLSLGSQARAYHLRVLSFADAAATAAARAAGAMAWTARAS